MSEFIVIAETDTLKTIREGLRYAADYARRYREYDKEQQFKAVGQLIANELRMSGRG